MLFSSFQFIFGFLPIALLGYWLLARHERVRLWYLLVISLVFYSYWDWRFTPLLVGSIIVNWAAAGAFFAYGKRAIVIAAIGANLLCLGVFKYLGFFESVIFDSTGWNPSLARLALPLGISFFTFHHIIYLADLLRGRLFRYSFRDYALYIALFPQILAGPLVRHREIIPQFPLRPDRPGWEERVVQGIGLFIIGLWKKMFLANVIAAQVDAAYVAATGPHLTIGDGWTATCGFALQIYFDFSGYSDMAIGLALLFGFRLPDNFAVPYRSTSMHDLWRRWHMTLSRFLRDYLFIPMAGHRPTAPGGRSSSGARCKGPGWRSKCCGGIGNCRGCRRRWAARWSWRFGCSARCSFAGRRWRSRSRCWGRCSGMPSRVRCSAGGRC
jgi:D-alanyl-lipoteichoic acid acyltransferase DltB (MBOAT superfamily)